MSTDHEHDCPLPTSTSVLEWAEKRQAEKRAAEAMRAAEERCCMAAMALAAAYPRLEKEILSPRINAAEAKRLHAAELVTRAEVLAAGSALARLRGGT